MEFTLIEEWGCWHICLSAGPPPLSALRGGQELVGSEVTGSGLLVFNGKIVQVSSEFYQTDKLHVLLLWSICWFFFFFFAGGGCSPSVKVWHVSHCCKTLHGFSVVCCCSQHLKKGRNLLDHINSGHLKLDRDTLVKHPAPICHTYRSPLTSPL